MPDEVVQIVRHELENALRIADVRGDIKVVKSELDGVREQQKAHHESNQDSFDEINGKLDDLTATMNQGKGAFAFALMAAGAIGAVVTKAITYVFTKSV